MLVRLNRVENGNMSFEAETSKCEYEIREEGDYINIVVTPKYESPESISILNRLGKTYITVNTEPLAKSTEEC